MLQTKTLYNSMLKCYSYHKTILIHIHITYSYSILIYIVVYRWSHLYQHTLFIMFQIIKLDVSFIKIWVRAIMNVFFKNAS